MALELDLKQKTSLRVCNSTSSSTTRLAYTWLVVTFMPLQYEPTSMFQNLVLRYLVLLMSANVILLSTVPAHPSSSSQVTTENDRSENGTSEMVHFSTFLRIPHIPHATSPSLLARIMINVILNTYLQGFTHARVVCGAVVDMVVLI